MWLKQSTAITLKLGPFLDSTDGNTVESSLTISQADVRLSKNGGAFAQKNDASAATHDENGWYGVPLNTTDTNTLGRLRIAIHESGALPVWDHYMVLPANVYDALVNGTDYLDTEVAAMALNTMTASALAADAVAEIQNGLATASAVNTIDDFLDTEIAAIKAKTDNLPADPADASDIAAAVAAVQADTDALQTAIAALNVETQVLDVLTNEALAEPASVPAATASMAEKISWIFAILRNRMVQTAGTHVLRNDDNSAAIGTASLTDDGTTLTRSEWS